MILLYFLIGTILCLAIARYNESNKLFWILYTSFMIGIAGGHIYSRMTEDADDDKVTFVNESRPTQALVQTFIPSLIGMLANEPELTTRPAMAEPVSQQNVSGFNESTIISSDYISSLLKPPTLSCIHILTPVDLSV